MNQHFFIKNIRKILAASIAVQCLGMVILLFTYVNVRRAGEQDMAQIADRFIEKVETELQNNNIYMNQTVILRNDYRTMFSLSDMELIGKISELQMMYKMLGEMAEIPYNYFVYDRGEGRFLELTRVKMQFSDYRPIRETMEEKLTDGIENGRWYLVDVGSQRIIMSGCVYGDYVLGTWTDEDSFLSGVKSVNWGPGGGVELLDSREGEDIKKFSSFGSSELYYSLSETNTDFSIRITISMDRNMLRLMLLQIVLVFMSVWVISILILLVAQVRKAFLIPTKNLTEILEKYQYHGTEHPSQKQASIRDAYEILDKLGSSAQKLMDELYASELEKKQLQINFRNLQIRPHFFVNCLTMLSAMAENEETEKISQITVCLSNYYRYVLHDCMDMVMLDQEIGHMQNVIRVNGEWNNNSLEFVCHVQEGMGKCRIPVLMIATFLENSIKHAVGREGTLTMCLDVEKLREGQQDYLYFKITDNGEGFPLDVTQRLNRGEFLPEKEGKHIGINNVMQRLKLIYAGRARIRFSTQGDGGACVEIWIPQEVTL